LGQIKDFITAAILIYFKYFRCTIDVQILYVPLYRCLPEDGDLSLQHVGGFMFMDNLYFCNVCMLVLLTDCNTLCRTDNITFLLTACLKTGNIFLLGYDAESIGFTPRRFEVTQCPYFERVKVIDGTLKMRTLRNPETSGSDTH